MAVWWGTRIECISAFTRRVRESRLDARGERAARGVLAELGRTWSEVQPTAGVRAMAERLLAVHPLRAADALQLAAALDWCDARTTGVEVVSFDGRLREAAHREGFILLPAE